MKTEVIFSVTVSISKQYLNSDFTCYVCMNVTEHVKRDVKFILVHGFVRSDVVVSLLCSYSAAARISC